MYLTLVAMQQHLLAQGCLLELMAPQQIGFELSFAQTKSSITMWL